MERDKLRYIVSAVYVILAELPISEPTFVGVVMDYLKDEAGDVSRDEVKRVIKALQQA